MSSEVESRAPIAPLADRAAVRAAVLPWAGQVACLLAIVALGIWTRFYQLGAESFWIDETTTFFRSRLPMPELIADSLKWMHVPSYFMIMHSLMRFGDDEWMLRMPSAVFGVLKIALIGGAGCILGGRRVGFVAALLLVLSPLHLRYDQEARMYAMQTFGTCLALLGQLWLLSRPEAAARCWSRRAADNAGLNRDVRAARWAWLAWIAGVTVALYSHNTSALYLVASACATLVLLIAEPALRSRIFWHWTLANAIVLLLWSPWLPSLAVQLSSPRFETHAWHDVPSLAEVLEKSTSLLLGGDWWPLNAMLLGLALAGGWQLRRRPTILLGLLLLSLLAPALLWLVSLRKPMFMPRLMLWGGPAFYLIAAHGVLALRRTWQQALMLSALTALALFALQRDYYAKVIKTDWRGAAQVLSKHTGDDVLALTSTPKERRPISYYDERTKHRIRLPRMIDARAAGTGDKLRKHLKSVRHVLYVTHVANTARSPALEAVVTRGRFVGRAQPTRVVIDHYLLPVRGRE